jgi:release factor glutamine methyltransferase
MSLLRTPAAAVPDPLVERLRAAGCVFAEDEATVLRSEADDTLTLERWTDRRAAGEPLEQIVGWAQFRGLRLTVAPGVFVPRTRTGGVVDAVVHLVRPGDVVVDLCCGTGAIGAALAHEVPGLVVHAVDIDPQAVACARANLGPGQHVYVGDLDAPLPRSLVGAVALVVANAPYVPSASVATMPSEARDHEALVALDGGADGLDLQRRVVVAASRLLGPGGVLAVETSRVQVDASSALVSSVGMRSWVVVDDDLDATVVCGRFPGDMA